MKILILGAMMISSPVLGMEQRIECPARYPSEVLRLPDVPKGWDGESQVRGNMLLDAGGFVAGPISGSSKAEMMGSGEIKTKDGFQTRYLLDTRIKERWFYCGYGGIELFHRIAVQATQCVIETKPQGNSKLAITIICK